MTVPTITNTLLVGIGFRARHGKNYLAERIHARMPDDSKIYGFADDLYAWNRVMGFMTSKNGQVLQLTGTDLFRKYRGEDIWINCLAHRILDDDYGVALIADMRFGNEFRWIKDNGGVCILVNRLNTDGTLYVDPSRPANHISEQGLADADVPWDFIVDAHSGNLRELNEASLTITIRLSEMRWHNGKELLKLKQMNGQVC